MFLLFKNITLHLKVWIWPRMKQKTNKHKTTVQFFYVAMSLTFNQAQEGGGKKRKEKRIK